MANSTGSSTPSDMPRALSERFGVPYRSMPETAEAVARLAGVQWDTTCDSRATPSGGGSTVTAEGLRRLRSALRSLIAEAQ